jgi:hypothetical protein
MRIHRFIVAASLSATLLALSASASAASPYQTKITVSPDAPHWHGDVKSAGSPLHGVRSCERKRLVKMYKRRDGKDLLIGTGLSNRAGRWSIPDKPTKGIYYAKVTERRPGDKPGCERDQSGIEYVR